MAELKTVGIRELKNQLSRYIREVKSGVVILVTDRGSVVAELREPRYGRLPEYDISLRENWISDNILIPAQKSKTPTGSSSLHTKKGTARMLIDRDRGE